MTRRSLVLSAAVAVIIAGVLAWRAWSGGEDAAIRARLEALRDLVNTSTSDGLGTIAHAAEIGSFFTTDVTIDLGEGAASLQGRDSVMALATQLQPRTATFKAALDDVNVTLGGDGVADVTLTAIFTRRSLTTGEESMDAREFALVLSKTDGEWRIARATAVDPLKQ